LAVGSGALLVGLLQAITWAVELLDWRLGGDDALVYEVYGLTEEKIVLVEEETTSDSGNTR